MLITTILKYQRTQYNIFIFIVTMILTILAIITILTYIIYFDCGTRDGWRIAVFVMRGKLSGIYTGGNLAQGIHLRNIHYRNSYLDFKIDRIDSNWKLSLIHRQCNINSLQIGVIDIKKLIITKSIVMPKSLNLPLTLKLHNIFLQKVRLHQGISIFELNNLKFHGSSDDIQHIFVLDQLFTKYSHANASLNLINKRPFKIQGHARLFGTYIQGQTQEKFALTAQLIGSLQLLNINVTINGNRLNGKINILAMPFTQLVFRKVQINIQHLNPNIFNSYAPKADLYLQAHLTSKVTKILSKNKLFLTGIINITNTIAGTIHQKRLPLVSMRAKVDLGLTQQNFSNVHIILLHNAYMHGAGYYNLARHSGNLNFQLYKLNLHTFHPQLKITKLHGQLNIKFTNNTQNIKLQLTDAMYCIAFDGSISREKIILRKIYFKTTGAVLNLSGTILTTAKISYTFIGKCKNFNLGFWLQTNTLLNPFFNHLNFQNKVISTYINMDFNVNGHISSETRRFKLNFNIQDSIYNTMPMHGQGEFELNDQQILPSKINLCIANNQFQLQGAFGTVSDTLNLHINAPQLAQLGYGLAGKLKLDSYFSGNAQHPTLRFKCKATNVSFWKHHFNKINCQANIENNVANNIAFIDHSKLIFNFNSTGYRGPQAIFHKLKLSLFGTYDHHKLCIQADGKIRKYILTLKLNVQGKLILINNNYCWDGIITTIKNYGSPYLLLTSPLHLYISNGEFCAGMTKLQVNNMIFNINNFHYQHGHISSMGQVKVIEINRLLELTNIIPDYMSLLKSDLILNVNWNITLGETAYGFVHINRQKGDINIRTNNTQFKFGLSILQLKLDLSGKTIQIHGKLLSHYMGNLSFQGLIILQKEANVLKLSSDALIRVHALFYLQNISILGPFLGVQYKLNGSLKIIVAITGTIADPKISTSINGNTIILTLLNNGIQLKDGTIRILIQNNLINLCSIKFYGSTGTLYINGIGKLDTNSSNFNLILIANQLQLFASLDRQLTVSGHAKLNNTKQQLHVNGKLIINKAWYDMLQVKKPTLGDDVIIINNHQQIITNNTTNTKQILTFSKLFKHIPLVTIQISLGKNFYLNAGNTDLHLQGNVIIHNQSNQSLHTTGHIQIVEGTYQVFGSKLNIEYGSINFHGPINNPTIDILAIRHNQNIESGFKITGKIHQPHIRLVSNLNIPDSEKLSWIMFGHGSESAGINQRTMTNQTLALMSNYGGKKIAKNIGLDQFFVGSSESGLNDDHVVNLAKAISKKLTISYEQSLNKATSIAKASLALSRHWSAVVQTGAIKGMKILFNNRYD